jgi:rifampicin phosphotransferase
VARPPTGGAVRDGAGAGDLERDDFVLSRFSPHFVLRQRPERCVDETRCCQSAARLRPALEHNVDQLNVWPWASQCPAIDEFPFLQARKAGKLRGHRAFKAHNQRMPFLPFRFASLLLSIRAVINIICKLAFSLIIRVADTSSLSAAKLAVAGTLALLMTPPALAAPNSRQRIDTEKQFNDLARTISVGRYASFPQMMFVIDRQAGKARKVHFVNSKAYPFHIDYIQKTYLSVQSIQTLYDASYFDPNRRFLLGSIVFYPALKRYGIEFWEGDKLTVPLIEETFASLQPLFPKPLALKPNSAFQIDLAATIPGLATIDNNTVYNSRDVLVLNPGRAVGRLRILKRVEPGSALRRGDIVVLDEAPIQMSPVAGVITTEFSTPLSHVNLLAKSWKIPNGYKRGAATEYVGFANRMVVMTANDKGIILRLANAKEVANAARAAAHVSVKVAQADLSFRGLPSLEEQHARDVIRTGAKAANLGEVATFAKEKKILSFNVPAGFSIPFAYYADFVKATGLDVQIDAVVGDANVRNNPALRQQRLKALRDAFIAAQFDPVLLRQLAARRDAVIGAGGVFARSSTNSEDLPGFNGAGLYTSVPNVLGDEALAKAVKTVWASVWNDAAFDAREAAGIDHKTVQAAVLVQRGMNADAAGVMITENPFEPTEYGAIFINAKRGLGIRVVEGRKVAEQLIYRPDPESIQVLTRSTDDAKLVFDTNGGVHEVPVEPGHMVLTDDTARRLALVGATIDRLFDGKAQDIEWLIIGDAIYVVQSRPYLRGN